jgi:biotin operon repressor
LRELAKQTGEFHGGAISRATGYSRKQVQSELRKLETIGLIERAGSSGRAELLRVADDELSDTVLALPELLVRRLDALRGQA